MKAKKKKTKGVLFVRNIDPTVKAIFKAVVYRWGDSMTRVVEALMKSYARNPGIVRPKPRPDLFNPHQGDRNA